MLIGYNYHPSRQGCAYWRSGDFSELARDLAAMAEEGCELVRFFLFWRDFEPQPGYYDERAFALLRRYVEMAAAHNLRCIPSLLTIWMNGQLFDLSWRSGRSLWTDAFMIERAERYVEKVAETLEGCGNIFAYDVGDELPYVDLPAAASVDPSTARAWLERIIAAIKRGDPQAKVLMAADHSALLGEHGFRLGLVAEQCDFVAIHGFPLWAPFAIPSNRSYAASLYVPFLTKLAAAFGQPLIDEFGLYGAGEEVRAAYVRTSGTSALLHGAEGLIAWCWQDFLTRDKPYDERPGEREVGFYTVEGTAKASAVEFMQCRTVAQWASVGTPFPPQAAVYLPESFRICRMDGHAAARAQLTALFHAFLLLTRLHVPMAFVGEELQRFPILFVPCLAQMTQADLTRLTRFVQDGGTLVYTPGSYLFGFGGEELFGVALYDFTRELTHADRFTWRGRSYPVDWWRAGFTQIPLIQATSAEVLSRYRRTLYPALTRQRLGKGQAFYLNAPLELLLANPDTAGDEPYRYLYRELLAEAGALPEVFFTSPDVELHRFRTTDGERCVLINHSERSVTGTLVSLVDGEERVVMAKKGVRCVNKKRV